MLRGQVSDLRLRRVLAQGAQEVAQGFTGDGPCPAFVEQGKGLSDLCVLGGLRGLEHHQLQLCMLGLLMATHHGSCCCCYG